MIGPVWGPMGVRAEILSPAPGASSRKVAEVTLIFEGGPLDRTRLTGFAVWESARHGGLHVTVPAVAIGTGADRRYRDYLRDLSGEDGYGLRGLRRWILSEYQHYAAVKAAGEASA